MAAVYLPTWRTPLSAMSWEMSTRPIPGCWESWLPTWTTPLWDDTATPEVEDASVIMQRAWAEADADLTAQMGEDHGAWTWGGIHVKKPTHQLLGGEGLPGIVRNHFNAPPRSVGGAGDIPNATWFDPAVKDGGRVDYQVVSGASMRMTVDMGDLDGARWVISSGGLRAPVVPSCQRPVRGVG